MYLTLQTLGGHHVTAITGDPGRNTQFYTQTPGLRFVKRTVNHDDTGTYQFYFGDCEGTPGTNITFFPWTEDGHQGEFGVGQTQTTAYLIHPDAVEYWTDRLESAGADVERSERLAETVLSFSDPDGTGLELVASPAVEESDAEPWADSPVPEAYQPRGFHSVTLAVPEFGPTESVLTDVLGYELEIEAGDRRRYRAAGSGPESVLDLARGETGVGTVHHVAFKLDDVEAQQQWREALADHGLDVSDIIDRNYFHATYAREPNGVLFEFSTMGPGFTADESVDELGSGLRLPAWLESDREEIEAELAPFNPRLANLRHVSPDKLSSLV